MDYASSSILALCLGAVLAAGLATPSRTRASISPRSTVRRTRAWTSTNFPAVDGWRPIRCPRIRRATARFDALQDRNREVLRKMLEAASVDKPGRSAIDQKIGDFYFACMDRKRSTLAAPPRLKPDLDRIAALKNKKDLAGAGGACCMRDGNAEFFNFSSEQDAKDSTQEIAGMDQGGLGLPDRDYYFKTDQKSVEQRAAYVAHVTKMFQLLGSSAAEAAKKAQTVMAIETALADGSFDRGDAARSGEGLSQDDGEGAGRCWARISTGPSSSRPWARPPSRAWTSPFRRS